MAAVGPHADCVEAAVKVFAVEAGGDFGGVLVGFLGFLVFLWKGYWVSGCISYKGGGRILGTDRHTPLLIVCKEGNENHESDAAGEDDIGHLIVLVRAAGGEEEDVGWSCDCE